MVIGQSREGRPIHGLRFGSGTRRVSLLAGCHADEPVGPLFLRHLAGYLATRTAEDPLLEAFESDEHRPRDGLPVRPGSRGTRGASLYFRFLFVSV